MSGWDVMILSLSGIVGGIIHRTLSEKKGKLYIPWFYKEKETGKWYFEDSLITEAITRMMIAWIAIYSTYGKIPFLFSFITGVLAAAGGHPVYRIFVQKSVETIMEAERKKILEEEKKYTIIVDEKEKNTHEEEQKDAENQ